ncbi:MAG TPA: trypsin-like peptidase domain-containing protein [Verrucomicrobia bacterium]|nr:trypsin-like peptidase domain-containing protein [Verrucomicrobiota bacterium]HOP97700.1 hypothetical protein [Verrucomicrobiota bacterium]HPU56343.1 hypothetical protein [Verrucomicrobiota bacterium]
MRYVQKRWLTAAAVLACLTAAPVRGDEVAEKGREILNRYREAVVTVPVVLRVSGSSGRSSESRQELTGTVVDPSGLTVLALSAVDPTDIYRRLSQNTRTDIEVMDIKIVQADQTELLAEIVLRDADLDLVFIRPKAKPSKPMAAVDLSKSGAPQVLDQVITLNRLNRAASRAYAASVERISAVVQRPRTFYIPDTAMTSTTLGSPAFLPDGRIVGVFVMRAVSSGGTADTRHNLTTILLPAEDILNGAKQAPEAGSAADRREAPAAEQATSSEQGAN